MQISPIKLNNLNSINSLNLKYKKQENTAQVFQQNNRFSASNCIANMNIAAINFKSNKPDTNFETHLDKVYSIKHAQKQNAQDAVTVAKALLDKLEKAKEDGLKVSCYGTYDTSEGTWYFGDPLYDEMYVSYNFTDDNNAQWSVSTKYSQKTNYIYDVEIIKKDALTGEKIKRMDTDCLILNPSVQNEISPKLLDEALNNAEGSYKNIDEKELIKESVKLNQALRNRYSLEKQEARKNGAVNDEEFTDLNNKNWYFNEGLNCAYSTQRKEWNVCAAVDYNNMPIGITITSKNLNTDEVEEYEINLDENFGYKDLYDEPKEPFSQIDFDKSDAVSQRVIDKQKELEERFFDKGCYLNQQAVIKKLTNIERYLDALEDMMDNIADYESDSDYYSADKDYLEKEFNKAYAAYKEFDERFKRKEFHQENIRAQEFQEERKRQEKLEERKTRAESEIFAANPELREDFEYARRILNKQYRYRNQYR